MTTLEKVQQLDDFKALRLFKHIETSLPQQLNIDSDALIAQLPDDIKQMPEVQQLISASEADYEENLDATTATKVARESLEVMAANPDTAKYLEHELVTWKDDEMVAGTILALGGALSAVMLLSTVKVGYTKAKGWEFSIGYKNKNQIEPLKLIFESLFKLLPKRS